jgi:hypothetical protein
MDGLLGVAGMIVTSDCGSFPPKRIGKAKQDGSRYSSEDSVRFQEVLDLDWTLVIQPSAQELRKISIEFYR